MIDIRRERLVPIRDARNHVPGRPHISAIYRWVQRAQNPLETVLVGGRRFTSIEAIDRFVESCNKVPAVAAPATAYSARREKEIAAAEAELRAAGIA